MNAYVGEKVDWSGNAAAILCCTLVNVAESVFVPYVTVPTPFVVSASAHNGAIRRLFVGRGLGTKAFSRSPTEINPLVLTYTHI